jgi:hypothetical protein
MNAKSLKYIRIYIIGSAILVFIHITILKQLSFFDLVNVFLKVSVVPIFLSILLDPLLFLFKSKDKKREGLFSKEWKDDFIESILAYWVLWNAIVLLIHIVRLL